VVATTATTSRTRSTSRWHIERDGFRELVQEAHRRDKKVVIDLVVHHTSNRHPRFQASRQSDSSSFRDYYIWADEPTDGPQPVNIFPTVEPSVWQFDDVAQRWYFHLFYKEEPDLNFANPVVRQRILEIIEFWTTFGVDGFRIDALDHLFESKGVSGTGSSDNSEILAEIWGF
jgi:maltose alpha-D-glucosyltransferase/alpha-amylase